MDEKFRDRQIDVLSSNESLQEERIQALFQLMNIADSKSLDAIVRCLMEDPCEIVRHEAAFVLGEAAAVDRREDLIKAVERDASGIVKHESILALGTIADERDVPFLKSLLSSKVRLVSESAKIALQRIQVVKNPYRGPEHFSYLKKT